MAETNSPNNIRAKARDGDPKAIAQLLNQSLRNRSVKAFVQRRQQRLLVLLESRALIDQQAIAPKIVEGLRALSPQGIDSVDILLRLSEQTQAAWRVQVQMATPAPPAPRAASPNADSSSFDPPSRNWRIQTLPTMPNPLVLPGWSFWFGWVVMSVLGGLLGPTIGRTAPGVSFRSFLAVLVTSAGVGIGQWLVLRHEVTWAELWLRATVQGACLSAISHIVVRWLLNYGGGPSFFLVTQIVLPLAAIAPVFICQWWVLKQRLGPPTERFDNPLLERFCQGANLWLTVTLSAALLSLLIGRWQPLYNGILLPSTVAIAIFLQHMANAGAMVYLLRSTRADWLKINRYTDVDTRRQLIAQRANVNGWFFLEWIGWTFVGWVVGGFVQLPLILLFPLNIFRVSVMISVVTLFQWIALQKRIPNSESWYQNTLMFAFGVPIVMGVLGLVAGGLILANLNNLDFYGAGALPMVAAIGIGITGFVVALLAVIAAQGKVLKQFGYRSAGWLIMHAMMVVTMFVVLPGNPSLTLVAIVGLFVLGPAATIVWILGYPKRLQSAAIR